MWTEVRTALVRESMTPAHDVRVTFRPTQWAVEELRVSSWVGRPRPGVFVRTGDTDPSSRRELSARPRLVREVSRASHSWERVAGAVAR